MSPMKSRSTLFSIVAITALIVAACGGDAGGDAPVGELAPQSDDGTESAGDIGADVEDIVAGAEEMLDEMVDSDGGVAVITIGADTWEFTLLPDHPIASCDADFFGGFLALFTSTAEITTPGNTFALTAPGGDFTDPPQATLKIQVGGDAEWIADETYYERAPELPPGIGVTSFSIDGNTLTGEGTFFEQESFHQSRAGGAELLQVEQGTFQITCG